MIAHVSFPVSNHAAAKKFYTKALRPLGYEPAMEFEDATGFMESGQTSFWISKKEEVLPSHVAFEAESKEAVDQFYKEALAAGAKDNGKPGYRKEYWPGYYAAFVYDADGNNVESVFYDYDKAKE